MDNCPQLPHGHNCVQAAYMGGQTTGQRDDPFSVTNFIIYILLYCSSGIICR